MLVSYVGVPDSKDVMSRQDYLKCFILSFKCSFPFVFAVTSYGVTEELYLSWKGGRVSLWENFSSLQGDILSLLIWLVLR